MTPEPPDTDEIGQELWLVVGGNFTPDAIGPERYEAQIERIREQAASYLDAFESMFLGEKFDPELQSRIHPDALLRITAEAEPDRTRALAQEMLERFDSVMTIQDQVSDRDALYALLPDETADVSRRIEQRRAQLRSLLS